MLGQEFLIRTDHAPLVWLRNFKEPEGLIARWMSIIETFSYQIQYRPGRQHQNADTLSRKPNRKCPNTLCLDCYPFSTKIGQDDDGDAHSSKLVIATNLIEESPSYESPATFSSPAPGQAALQQTDRETVQVSDSTRGNPFAYWSPISPLVPETRSETQVTRDSTANWLPTWSPEDLSKMQMEDASISVILEHKLVDVKPTLDEIDKTNYSVKALWYQWNDLEVRDKILYRKWVDQKGNIIFQLVTPDAIKDLIFSNLHSARTAGHFGRDRTIESVQRRFYWPGYRKDIS